MHTGRAMPGHLKKLFFSLFLYLFSGMTNRPTNRMGWVESSAGGPWSYNQSPSAGLSRCLGAAAASGTGRTGDRTEGVGRVRWGWGLSGEGGKKKKVGKEG